MACLTWRDCLACVVKPEYHKMPDRDSWFDKVVYMSKMLLLLLLKSSLAVLLVLHLQIHIIKFQIYTNKGKKNNAAEVKMFRLGSKNTGTNPSHNVSQ